MSVVSWGKPTIEICAFETDGSFPETPVWTEITPVLKDSAKLNTEDGEELEVLEEGGGVIDSKTEKSKFSFECTWIKKKGESAPITDADGVVTLNYAVRLTPEDTSVEGWIMDKTSVKAKSTWAGTEGERVVYTFKGLVPDTGNILKEYTAS